MNNAANLLNEAQALLESGQLAPARERFVHVCDIDPENAEAWLMLGAIDAETGNLDGALSHTRRALQEDPDYEEAHLALARMQQHRGELEEALQSCGRALSIDSDYEEAWLMQSGIQGALGRYVESEQSSRQVIRLWPECVDAHVNLGNALKARGMWDEAIESYRQALKMSPGLVDVLANVGEAFLAKADAESALENYKKALELDAGHKGATLGTGSALVLLERPEEAAPYAGKALDYFPESAEANYMQGRVLQDQGDADRAQACYEKALTLNPQHVRSHFYLGTVFHGKNDLDKALGCYKEAVKLKPDYAQVYFRIGIIYQLQRQLDEAIFNYKESARYYKEIAEDTDVPKSVLVSTYCQLGFLYGSLLDDRDEAISYYRMALELDPEHEKAKHYLAALGEGEAPQRASDGYVADLFDAMSDNFDDILVGTLEYKTPQRLFDAVKQALPNPSPAQSILDLGCGTGLCAPVFRDITEFMAGVDLSPKMVEKARQRNLYDLLVTGELTEAMRNADRKYSLVLSADVFVYIGDLGEVFTACFDVMEPGGLFAFSNESVADENQDYVLNKSGRYAHSRHYIEALARRLNFSVVSYEKTVIRKEGGVEVAGMIFVLQKPG